MTESAASQPDDLAPGVYRDCDGDLWVVDHKGLAYVLTDRYGSALIPISELGTGMPADEAHAAYTLRLFISF